MKLNYSNTTLKPVDQIDIPDTFFRRLHTGVEIVDKMFGGEGILPGMVFTVSAAPGVGKTTLMLQICEALASRGYSTGYISGEECVTMLAYTCRRLGAKQVQVCHETEIDKICSFMERLDFMIIDSFACLLKNGDRQRDDENINQIVEAAKQNECAVGVILHQTKNGKYKGSTAITHAVDCVIDISISEESDLYRDVNTSKNRYGTPYHGVLQMTGAGYDLSAVVDTSNFSTSSAKSKGNRKEDEILAMKEPPSITVDRVVSELNISEAYARQTLYKMARDGKLIKIGSGSQAVWKHPVKDVE